MTGYRTPAIKNTDLVFAAYQNKQNPDPFSLYAELGGSFAKTLDRLRKGEREDGNERRRQVISHSIRRFVKTGASDLGYPDY